MKKLVVLFFILSAVLTACGTPTEEGLLFQTADPNLTIGFRWAVSVEPEIVPEEEVGEVLPEPVPTPPAIVIKGNISRSTGEKIYHLPGMANYDNVKIDEDAGERFFESEEEAVAAGWRKALR